MAVTCRFCLNPMDGSSCNAVALVEGVWYHRRPYEPDYETDGCHDCAVLVEGFHHAGCDMEECPRCLQQAIACGCKWQHDEPENDEHPDARQADMS